MILTRLTGFDIATELKEFKTPDEVFNYMKALGLSVTTNERAIYKDFNEPWEIHFPFDYKKLSINRV